MFLLKFWNNSDSIFVERSDILYTSAKEENLYVKVLVMPMDKIHNIIDLNEKRVVQNRKIYLQGEDEENVKINSKEIMEAREFLMEKTNLLEYKDRIGVVTSYLSEERKKDKSFGIFYLIFTKALDCVLTYDKVDELIEAFVRYLNMIYGYRNRILRKDMPKGNDGNKKLLDNIKVQSLDVQSLIFSKVQEKKE